MKRYRGVKGSGIAVCTAAMFFVISLLATQDADAAGTWNTTDNMTTARYNHTSTLLPNGRVLIVGGSNSSGSLASAEICNPENGTWTSTGTMNSARLGHTATLLPNGRVLIVGGSNSSGSLASAEIYNPENGTWSATGTMNSARSNHTATLLPNGRVLVIGGYNGSMSVVSAEIYNPENGTWTLTGIMNSSRHAHTATLLPNGRVLVAGGRQSGTGDLASAEIYNPDNGTWTSTGTMNSARLGHTSTLLPSGRVLVAGGDFFSGSTHYLASAEIYNPDNATWTTTGTMNSERYVHTATLLPNGRVLVAGGYYYNAGNYYLASAEIYSPDNATWSTTGTMNSGRNAHTATLLPNGRVLVAGGHYWNAGNYYHASAEIYNFDNNGGTWTPAGTLNTGRAGHTATLLPSGRVLVAGGWNDNIGYLASVEIYNPDNATWAALGTMNSARGSHTSTLLANGRVLVAGGTDGISFFSSSEIYDPVTGSWTTTGTLNNGRCSHTATLLPSGRVLVAGGYNGSSPLASAELFNPDNGTWSVIGSMNSVREYHTATLLPSGRVLVAGGYNGSSPLASAELCNPDNGTWSATGTMSSGRGYHTATLLPNGSVLVAGGYNIDIGHLASAELYNPDSGTWSETGTMSSARLNHTATLLPNGKVLIDGGEDENMSYSISDELFGSNPGFEESWRPVISAASSPLYSGDPLTLTGSRFRGISQASSGATTDSPTNYPLVQLRRIDNVKTQWLLPDPANSFSETNFSSVPLEDVLPGPVTVTVFVNGKPSKTKIIFIAPSYSLNIDMAGLGSGVVTSTPEGIDCPGTCSFLFHEKTNVTLTATPGTGYVFSGWSGGGCSGTGACQVTMDAKKNVTATFSCTYNLNPLSASGLAAGFSGFFNVTTGADCNWTTDTTASWIRIDPGSSGQDNGTVTFSVERNNGPARSDNITVGGQHFTVYQDARFADDGSSTVSDNITGLEWFRDAALQNKTFNWQDALDAVEALNAANGGAGTYGHNDWRLPTKDELVGLLDNSRTNPALPAGYPFTGVKNTWYWTSSTNLLSPDYTWVVHLGTSAQNENYNKTQTAYVWPVRCDNSGAFRTLQVTASGPGSGAVKNMPYDAEQESQNMQNLLCEPVCFNAFTEAMMVKLQAYPESRMTFEGWDGCDNVTTDNACIVLMNQAREVVANFGDPYGLNKLHKAIIVAGSGPYAENNLWNTTGALMTDVYDVLLSQGYTDEKIYYLTFATNTVWPEGSDNESGSQKLEHAIKGWAADADTLVIYLMGHGLTGEFEINGITHEFLEAASLREWLDELQASKNMSVIVVYEGCYSGSFLPELVPGAGLADAVRIVITSADEDEKAWFAMLGDVSFSKYFWNEVEDGQTVDVCFQSGFDVMNGPGYQTALMDGDADGKSTSSDREPASNYVIGRGILNAGSVPVTGTICADQWITGSSSATISMSNISPIPGGVWAIIRRPGDGGQTDPRAVTDLDFLTLGSGTASCSEEYTDFTEPGVYTIVVNALVGEKISKPWVTHVIKDIDAYEEDDAAGQAKPIVVSGAVAQYHNFGDTGDVDWVKFYGMPGATGQLYAIQADPLAACQPGVVLYGPDDPTMFIEDNATKLLKWQCQTEGMYYIKIYPADGSSCSSHTGYELNIYNPDAPVLGMIKGSIKDTGGSPVTNAVLTTDGGYSALSSNGAYEMPHKGGGPFTLEAEAAGYEPYSQPGINLADRGMLTLNIVMTPIGGATTTTTVPEGETTTTTAAVTTSSSTTTIRRLCPARQALGDGSEAELDALRVFRDKRLNQSAEGAKMVGMYYRHAAELTAMFERKPEIAAQVREIIFEILPQLGAQKLSLSNDMKQQLLGLIDELRTDASPGLKKSLRQVRKKIEKDELELK